MAKVIHFEIPSENPEKAQKFYSDVFGWRFNKWGEMPYWLTESGQKTEPGIEGAITMKTGFNKTVVNTIGVDDIDNVMEGIKASGGEVISEKMPIPTMGWFAYFKDPDGNIQGIMQNDPNAK